MGKGMAAFLRKLLSCNEITLISNEFKLMALPE
jgi:hypothetical protein